MYSILHFFLLIVSCGLCTSEVLLFTQDFGINAAFHDLLNTNPEKRIQRDDIDNLSEDMKQNLCNLIIQTPFFSDKGLEYVDKRDPAVSNKFCNDYPWLIQDHYSIGPDKAITDNFVVSDQTIVMSFYHIHQYASFGCLAKVSHYPRYYPYQEIFISMGYVFNTFIISERVHDPPHSELRYVGIAELSGRLLDTSLSELITENNIDNLVVLPRVERMTQSRKRRVCHIVVRELANEIIMDRVIATFEREGITNIQVNNHKISLEGKFYCSVENLKYYLVFTKTDQDVFVLEENSAGDLNLMELRITGIPTLDLAYDTYDQ